MGLYDQLRSPAGSALPAYGIPAAPQRTMGALKYSNALANGRIGLQDNAGAASVYAMTGYQPTTTVGGAWGHQNPSIDASLAQYKRNNSLDYMRDPRGYDALHAARQTLDQAIADPNFNADGRYFQGARLGKDSNGRAIFVGGPRAPTGSAAGLAAKDGLSPEERKALIFKQMELAGKGYYDSQTGRFIGAAPGSQSGTPSPLANALVGNDLAQRTAGVVGRVGNAPTSPTLTPQQQSFLADRAQRQQASQLAVTQRAQSSAAERKARMSGPTLDQQLAMQNPQLYAQGQIARGQMQNELAIANLQNQGNGQRDRMGLAAALVQGGVPADQVPSAIDSIMGQQGGPAQGLANRPPPANDPTAPIYYGGVVNSQQKEAMAGMGPEEVRNYLQQQGKSKAEIGAALQSMYGNPGWGMLGARSAEAPTWLGAVGQWWKNASGTRPPLAFPKGYTPEQERATFFKSLMGERGASQFMGQ